MPRDQLKREYMSAALAALLIAAYLAVFSVIDFRGFTRLITSDMYQDTLVARLMWEQKTLFPGNYLFGNQFYIIATPVLSALFYGLCGSLNRAVAWATLCMSVFLLLSMEWMLRPYCRRLSLRLSVLVVFLSTIFGANAVFREDGQQLFFTMCSFYACYLICFFVVLGDYARARDSRALRLPALLLSLALCFCTGMQSLRQTCVLILPLLCYEGLAALLRKRAGQPLYARGQRMRLWRALAYAAANLLGLLTIRLLPVKRHEIYSGSSIFSGASLRDKLLDLQRAFVTVSGYDYTRAGEARLFFCLMFLSLTGLILAAIWLILRRRAKSGQLCFWLAAVLACLAVIAASFMTSVQLRPIYLFPYYTLPALSLAVVAERCKPRLRAALIACVCALAAANLYFSYRDELRVALDPEPSPAQLAADWIMDNGYELVYGNQSLSTAAVAVCSDGALTGGCWQDDYLFKISPHINIRDIYSLDDAKRAVFVFLPWEVPLMEAETQANGTEMTLRGQFGYYSLYTASRQCLWPITETIDYVPEYN